MLTRLTFALTALALLVAPARADCARAQLATMCEWTAVEEWLAQQRAEAEARARMWQLFGPQPSTARIEEVRQWSLGSLARRVLRGPSPAMARYTRQKKNEPGVLEKPRARQGGSIT
jgi:hypothetical protein